MNNFDFYNPTHIVFGKDRLSELDKLVPKDANVLILYGGGSIKKFGTLEKVKANLKNRKVVEFSGIEPNPKYETLVKAVAKIVEQGQHDLLVLIIGDGEERPRLEKLIAELRVEGYVKLLGLRDDVIELMREADIFVIPSSYEGLSIAMIEAMACGCPVVTTEAVPCAVDGKNAVVCKVKNVEGIKEGGVENLSG